MFIETLSALISSSIGFIPLLLALGLIFAVAFVRNVRSYPPGPFPLPIIGNILYFMGTEGKVHPVDRIKEFVSKYGEIFTIWIGTSPTLFVNNYDLSHEGLIEKRNDFAARSDNFMHEILRSGHEDMIGSSGPAWEVCRKVGHVATRKYALSESLPIITQDVIDQAAEVMVKEKQPMDPGLYIDLVLYNIISTIAFGQRFRLDDKEFLELKRFLDEFYYVAGDFLPQDFMPYLKPFFKKKEDRLKKLYQDQLDYLMGKFLANKATYQRGKIRHFIDSVLYAKEDALREDPKLAEYMTDENLVRIVSDLYAAGADTTQTATRWMVLLLANYPDIQDRVHKEIVSTIGDRPPQQSDKDVLHYTMAFLLETLRFRMPTPLGLDKAATVDTELGGYKIRKGTRIMFNFHGINNSLKHWPNPTLFEPSRHLKPNGELNPVRSPYYVAFGMGRRSCPGEKLATSNAFLMIVRFVQKLRFEMPNGPGTADFETYPVLLTSMPKQYKVNVYLRD